MSLCNVSTLYLTGSESSSWIAKEKFPPYIPCDITTRNWSHVTYVTTLYQEKQQTKQKWSYDVIIKRAIFIVNYTKYTADTLIFTGWSLRYVGYCITTLQHTWRHTTGESRQSATCEARNAPRAWVAYNWSQIVAPFFIWMFHDNDTFILVSTFVLATILSHCLGFASQVI
jgi:hypothetical protein